MSLFQAIILSVLEGVTEFLPISSTGHLLVAQKYLGITGNEFTKTFTIVIQLAAILAVVWLFREKVFRSVRLWRQTLVAFLPTGIIGLISYKYIRNVFFENPEVVAYSLFLGGVLLFLVDRLPKISQGKKEIGELTLPQLFNIGVYQAFSIIPGVSRSAASIIGGLVSGLSRFSAVEFSFFLAIPTMLAATGYDLIQSGLYFTSEEYIILLVGCLGAFVSALISVSTLIKFLKKHDFTIFALYRILFAIFIWLTLKP